jgi:hypothetical protein
MKLCLYRNCLNEIVGDKIYCCRSHKENEKKYRNREKNPKKIGRPRVVYKRINELTEEDKRILELVMRKVD